MHISYFMLLCCYAGVRLQFSLREEHRLREFENRILRSTFGPKAQELT